MDSGWRLRAASSAVKLQRPMNLCSWQNSVVRQNLNPAKTVVIVLISTSDAGFSEASAVTS
jgi:hypothetical protein